MPDDKTTKTSAQRRSSAAAKRDGDDEAKTTPEAAGEEHTEAATQPEQPQGEQGGATTPPPPPAPTAEQQADADENGEAIDKAVLISRAPTLLGVESALAQGVLAEADDKLTIGVAKRRIQEFLDKPVQNETDTEEA